MADNLIQSKRGVMNEYAMQVAALMGYPKQYEWIGDHTDTDSLDTLDIGEGVYFFSWSDLQVIIDNMPKWVETYGSRNAVAEQIELWFNWWLDNSEQISKETVLDVWENRLERSLRTYPHINLYNWLSGSPRDPRKETPHDRLRRLKVEKELVMQYIDEYGGYSSLRELLYELVNLLSNAQDEVNIINKKDYELFLNSEKGKECMNTLNEAIANETNT